MQVGSDKFSSAKRLGLMGCLAVLVAGTVGAGLYFRHYYVVSMFAVWLAVEWGLWRFSPLWHSQPETTESLPRLSQLLTLYGKSDEASESLLFEKMNEARFQGSLTDYERRWLERLRDLIELRALAFGRPGRGKRALRQAFLVGRVPGGSEPFGEQTLAHLTEQDILESAGVVADLYWKLYHTSLGEFPDLSLLAERLFQELFGAGPKKGRDRLERVADLMQRDRGVPFLMLNLISTGRLACARSVGERLLTEEVELEEDLRSTLYWIGEVLWFAREREEPISDFETTIRYLYHLCFTNPDRAGFLEIDSQFYGEFENVNELAREGFLFRESLFERILGLWKDYPRQFDGVFRGVCEVMTGQRSKVYDRREAWEKFWERERENFGKEYLAVVEGNLCFVRGHHEDALGFYQSALELAPGLRPALFNSLFCHAAGRNEPGFERALEAILKQPRFLPASLYVIGDAYLLLGKGDLSDHYYDELKEYDGWRTKGDYYRSTFCFNHELPEPALEFARRAAAANPNDTSVAYHLSKCWSALGEKEKALKILKENQFPEVDWMAYYRFTLERDAGHTEEASRTLMGLSREYFEDPDEWEAAVEFARSTKDLKLLRHLKAAARE